MSVLLLVGTDDSLHARSRRFCRRIAVHLDRHAIAVRPSRVTDAVPPAPDAGPASVTNTLAGEVSRSLSRLNSIAFIGNPQPGVGESSVDACEAKSSRITVQNGATLVVKGKG
jgi:hypothetical protein